MKCFSVMSERNRVAKKVGLNTAGRTFVTVKPLNVTIEIIE